MLGIPQGLRMRLLNIFYLQKLLLLSVFYAGRASENVCKYISTVRFRVCQCSWDISDGTSDSVNSLLCDVRLGKLSRKLNYTFK